MAGFGLQIAEADDYTDPRITYLLHELGEETRHSRLFARLLDQLGPAGAEPHRQLVHRPDRQPGRRTRSSTTPRCSTRWCWPARRSPTCCRSGRRTTPAPTRSCARSTATTARRRPGTCPSPASAARGVGDRRHGRQDARALRGPAVHPRDVREHDPRRRVRRGRACRPWPRGRRPATTRAASRPGSTPPGRCSTCSSTPARSSGARSPRPGGACAPSTPTATRWRSCPG